MFRDILITKIKITGSCHWLVMLSMQPAPFRQSSSRAKVTDASRDLAAIRDALISPPHLTKPERWPLPEGPLRRGGLLHNVAIFNIGIQWQDPEILTFCYKNIS